MISKKKQQMLVDEALTAREMAYTLRKDPIKVGAALLDYEDNVHFGCNIVNDNSNLGVCAERVAIFNAVSAGSTKFRAIAIVTNQDEILMSCGACRQVMWQFARDNAKSFQYIMADKDGTIISTHTLEELYPFPFELRDN